MAYEQQTSPGDLHAMPAARRWIVQLCPPGDGEIFALRLQVSAGYLGYGEWELVERHVEVFYPGHLVGDAWPTN